MCASCVELVTFDQMRQRYPQLEQHRIAPSGGAFCRAERLKGGGAAGTYAMPRPMAPTGEKHFFGFYLTQRRLLLAEDGEFLRGLADEEDVYPPQKAPAAPTVSSRSLFACTWRRLSPEASPIKR